MASSPVRLGTEELAEIYRDARLGKIDGVLGNGLAKIEEGVIAPPEKEDD